MDSHFVSTMEAAQYQYQMMDPEPGVGLPDLTQYQQQHMHMLSRRSNASVEHWLTSESPVARASFCNGSVYPQDQYRLPSLSLETAIPDSLPFPEPQPLYPLQYRRYELNDSPVEEPLHHLHLSDGEFHPHHMDEHYTWHSSNGSSRSPQEGPWLNNQDYLHHRYMVPPPSPYSASSMLYDSSNGSAFPSPELQHTAYPTHIPRSLPLDDCEMDEDEETSGGKPYAQLIQECLLQAPGHRMMLRDIYAWFEQNTTKPRESGGNGWQNSIRHNLSMNKAFENDKTLVLNARGEQKKATSVWFLTEYALRHGVQSTTRYRKQNGARRSPYCPDSDWKRVQSGSKGGKAARKAAHLRRIGAAYRSSRARHDGVSSFEQHVHTPSPMDEFAGTRGSSPMSPPDYHPCTPKDPLYYHPDALGKVDGAYCDAGELLGYHDVQLHDALSQAGYGPETDMSCWPEWQRGVGPKDRSGSQ